MAIAEEVRKRRLDAMKSKDADAKSILDVVLGEIESLSFNKSQSGPVTDKQVTGVINGIIKSNDQVLTYGANPKLVSENDILRSLLPEMWSREKITEFLASSVEVIKAAENDGKATGLAMKVLKADNADVNGDDVKAVVQKFRE